MVDERDMGHEECAALEAAEAFYARLKESTGCQTLMELAQFFGVPPAIISDWKRRAGISRHHLEYLKLRGINPEWVASGLEEKALPVPDVGSGHAELHVACPLKSDILRMLAACEHCPAWARRYQTQSLDTK